MESIAEELFLIAIHTRETYDSIQWIVNALKKKDPATLSKEKLAKSSVMSRLCRQVMDVMDTPRLPSEARKMFYYRMADHIFDELGEE